MSVRNHIGRWVAAIVLLTDPKILVLLKQLLLLQLSPLFLGWVLCETARHEPAAHTEVLSIHPNHSNTPHIPRVPSIPVQTLRL